MRATADQSTSSGVGLLGQYGAGMRIGLRREEDSDDVDGGSDVGGDAHEVTRRPLGGSPPPL